MIDDKWIMGQYFTSAVIRRHNYLPVMHEINKEGTIMKKVVSLMLIAAMTVGLTACGSKTEEAASTDAAAEETEAGEEAEGETAATDGEKFVIGGLGPLTGAAASYGISVKQGAEIAVKEINENGGVQVGDTTYTLELNFADDEASEDKVITAYNSLMDSGINALLGCVTSGACLAVIDQTYADGILQITPSGSAMGCTEYDNAFRLCFTDPLQGVTMADYAVDELGFTKIAIIYNNADEYSTGIMEAFVEEAESKGAEIVANEAFVTDDVDFKTQLTSIKATDAEVIFVPAYYQDATYITQQAKDLGMELPFLGSDGWDGVLSTVTDPTTVEDAVFLSPFLASDPAVADFVSAYEEAYGAPPDQFAADGYDTVYVIKAAMEQAGSIESADLIAAMTEIQVDGLTGSVKFTADGEPEKGAKFVVIKDGEYTAK